MFECLKLSVFAVFRGWMCLVKAPDRVGLLVLLFVVTGCVCGVPAEQCFQCVFVISLARFMNGVRV